MAKKEKIFPLNTIGGRIQRKRHELNLSRSEFYDLIFENRIEDGSAGSDSSKEKTVYNWESEKTELDYSTILSVCRILKCSSDYLLGLDECTTKNQQFISEETGLSEGSIIQLQKFDTTEKYIINLMFEEHYFPEIIKEIKENTALVGHHSDISLNIESDNSERSKEFASKVSLRIGMYKTKEIFKYDIQKHLMAMIDSIFEDTYLKKLSQKAFFDYAEKCYNIQQDHIDYLKQNPPDIPIPPEL